MIRWFWRAYVTAALCLLLAYLGGPTIESSLFPIRGPQSILVIERTDARLCWAWTFVKKRTLWSDNLDAFVRINGVPSGVVAPYDMDSGYPWGIARLAVPPRSEPYTLRQCVALPPVVKSTDAIEIRQTAFYSGWLGLWRLSVPFPLVSSPHQD